MKVTHLDDVVHQETTLCGLELQLLEDCGAVATDNNVSVAINLDVPIDAYKNESTCKVCLGVYYLQSIK